MRINKKRLFAIIFDGSMDTSLGIIAAAGVVWAYGEALSLWLLLVGTLGAHSPDMDGAWFFARSGIREAHNLYKHRSGFHYPVYYLTGAYLVSWCAGYAVAPDQAYLISAAFTGGALLHFAHDTCIHGWGIPWLYPFVKKRIALFHCVRPEKKLPWVLVFPVSAVKRMREEYRDPEWYRLFFKNPPHPWTCAIMATHVVAIIILFGR